MDNIKWMLSTREEQSEGVQALLSCLTDTAFDLDVYICSVGGVGSTDLSNFLTRHGLRCNLLTDQDSIRHTNTPPQIGSPQTRVVYLFGDPLTSICSHYRRGHAAHQATKTSGSASLDPRSFPLSFEDYVARGEDLFGYGQHLNNWLNSRTTYDILFVRYEQMFKPQVARRMLEHLCEGKKSTAEVQQMADAFSASKRQRRSRVTQEQRDVSVFKALQEQVDGLAPLFLKKASGEVVELLHAFQSLV